MAASRAEQIVANLLELPAEQRRPTLVKMLGALSEREALTLLFEWGLWARAPQIQPEGDWIVWLLRGGRGTGKTRTGAEWIRHRVEHEGARRIALIAATGPEGRAVMVEGESGLLEVFPPDRRPIWKPSIGYGQLTFHTGAKAFVYSAAEPDRLRGPQHDTIWGDELAAWRYATDAWDNALFGLRLGRRPRAVVTTTPRPRKIIRDMIKDPTVHVTSGSTYDNLANLPPVFVHRIISRFEGTRRGRQEIWGEVLEEMPGALWTRTGIEARRVANPPVAMTRIVVAIDPPGSSEDGGAEAGIVVAGLGEDGNAYVLDDRSKRATPGEWAREAIAAFIAWEADRIVAEVNYGGEMVAHTIAVEDARVPVTIISASRGKRLRAEPIASLSEPDKRHPPFVFFAGGFPELEDQLCNWVPDETDESPDRLDAMVYAITELLFEAADDADGIVEYEDRVRISPH